MLPMAIQEMQDTGPVTIGRLARKAGLGAETLRHYERLGLIRPARRSAANYRLYGPETERRLTFIRRAQALGFSLAEIRELLDLHHRSEAKAGEIKALTERRIEMVKTKIADLEHMRDGLNALARQCDGERPSAECPILLALSAPEAK